MPTDCNACQPTTVPQLLALFEAMSQGIPCSFAFDGDGTLWSGDVSDDVFGAACRAEWLLEPIRSHLLQLLGHSDPRPNRTVGQLALELFEAERQGRLDEKTLFEVMTYCYAGRTAAELSEFAARALDEANLSSRIRYAYLPLLDWARQSGHECWLVTASPHAIARVAASRLGFQDDEIIAAQALTLESGAIVPAMAAPLPYREQKLAQLNQLRKRRRLLAAFGDSQFDLELLAAAEVGVAVNPKPALARALPSLSCAFVLSL